MNKRKPAKASKPKHAHSPKIAAKAQQAAQAIVRSPKGRHLPSAGARPAALAPQRHNSPQEALPVENPAAPLENHGQQTMMDKDSKQVTNFSSAVANVPAYQAKLLEMAQANMQLAFEFAQRLATIRSPLEFPGVIAEFTSKRIAMFRKHSTELSELNSRG